MGRVGLLSLFFSAISMSAWSGQMITIPAALTALDLFSRHPNLKIETTSEDAIAQEGCRFIIYQPTIQEGEVKRSENRLECAEGETTQKISLANVPFVYWGSRYDSAVQIPDSKFARELFTMMKEMRGYSGDESAIDYGSYPDYNFDDVSNSYTLHDGPLTAKNNTRAILFCDQNSDKKRGIYRTNCTIR